MLFPPQRVNIHTPKRKGKIKMTAHEQELLNIANKELFYFLIKPRESLDSKGNDEDDFYDLAIWNIKSALEAAYQLGRKDERKRNE